MTPDHPDRDSLRCKFLEEHTHAEDEVRFLWKVRLVCAAHRFEVLSVLCERGA